MAVDSLTSLRASLANVDAQIAALTSGGLLVDYSLDGESYSPAKALRDMMDMREMLREQIIAEEGPAEERTVGLT